MRDSKCLTAFLGLYLFFLPLFQVHSWLVHGLVKTAPCSYIWSSKVNKTATTWLQHPGQQPYMAEMMHE